MLKGRPWADRYVIVTAIFSIGIIGSLFVAVEERQSLIDERDEAIVEWCDLLHSGGMSPDVKGDFRGSLATPWYRARWIRWCLLGPGESGLMTDAEIEAMRREIEAFEREHPSWGEP